MDELKFTSVADSSQMEHAKRSQELQSGVSPRLPFLHRAAMSWAWEPLGTTAGAAHARSGDRRAFPLNRLDPALYGLPGLPAPPHYTSPLVVKGRCQLTLFLFSFQSFLVPSFFLLLFCLIKDSIILEPGERRITFACGMCAFHAHLSSNVEGGTTKHHILFTC